MLDVERQNEILRLLQEGGSLRVSDLAARLYVSTPTVRRDLRILEEQGVVMRTHGGVLLRQTTEREIPLAYREDRNNASKRQIAERAANLVHDGDVIFLDASSTVAYLVPHLDRFRDVIVVTNSPKTSLRLGELGIKNYCTGGWMLRHSIAYVGSETEWFVAGINADVFFFSSRGYTEGGSITDSSVEEASVRRAMLKNARRAYYLCDSSKRGKTYAYNICATGDVDGIISDEA